MLHRRLESAESVHDINNNDGGNASSVTTPQLSHRTGGFGASRDLRMMQLQQQNHHQQQSSYQLIQMQQRGLTPTLTSVRGTPSSPGLRAPTSALMKTPQQQQNTKQPLITLSLDSALPLALTEESRLLPYFLTHIFILIIYTTSYIFGGLSLSTPQWSDSSDKLLIIGWIFHLLGCITFIVTAIALGIKKTVFKPKILLGYIISLLLFLIGSVLHTTHLGTSAALSELRVTQPNATSADLADDITIVSSVIGLPDDNSKKSRVMLSLQLQWLAAALFYVYASVLIWKATKSAVTIPTAAQLAKHKLLIELRDLVQMYSQLHTYIYSSNQNNGAQNDVNAMMMPSSPDILVIDRPDTGTGGGGYSAVVAAPPLVKRLPSLPVGFQAQSQQMRPHSRSGKVADSSGIVSGRRSGKFVTPATLMQPQPQQPASTTAPTFVTAEAEGETHMQHALAIQEALAAEAQQMMLQNVMR